ncbi:MAG: helix-turn-helix domain-containing protein [Acidimicrobiales bacterium]
MSRVATPVTDPLADIQVFNLKEVEHRLGLSHESVYKLIRTDQLKSIRVLNRRMVRVADLRAYLETR